MQLFYNAVAFLELNKQVLWCVFESLGNSTDESVVTVSFNVENSYLTKYQIKICIILQFMEQVWWGGRVCHI